MHQKSFMRRIIRQRKRKDSVYYDESFGFG